MTVKAVQKFNVVEKARSFEKTNGKTEPMRDIISVARCAEKGKGCFSSVKLLIFFTL